MHRTHFISYLYMDNLAFSGSVTPAAVGNTNLDADLRIYPNPVTGTLLSISLPANSSITSVTIADMAGKTVLQTIESTGNSISIDVSSLVMGQYLAIVNTKDGTTTKRFTKQ